MKLICIKGLEDDDNDIDDVFHVDYSDRFISVCGYIYSQKKMVGDVARWIKNAGEVRSNANTKAISH